MIYKKIGFEEVFTLDVQGLIDDSELIICVIVSVHYLNFSSVCLKSLRDSFAAPVTVHSSTQTHTLITWVSHNACPNVLFT